MRHSIDRSLFLTILFLLGLGLVQVYSSSFIFAIESFDDGLFFVKRQALFALISILVLLLTAYSPWKWIEKFGLALWVLSVVGIGLTLIPGFGVKVGGATRWLAAGGSIRIEPSELLKYTYPIMLAYAVTNDYAQTSKWKNILLLAAPILPIFILLKQPDFGSVAILTIMTFTILFSQGLKWRYVVSGLTTLAIVFYFLIVKVDYRMARVTAFLDPWSDPAQKGFQVIQSLLGFYSGGVTGVGLGQGQVKLFFLPEAHTDFTMSVMAEELGFIGITAVMLIFGYVVFRGLQISVNTKNEKSQIIALGVILMFAITAVVNISVAMGMLPTKGLGMPFLSYGGSAMVASCFGLGLLLNIDRTDRVTRTKSFIKIKH